MIEDHPKKSREFLKKLSPGFSENKQFTDAKNFSSVADTDA